jgi:hypothetical protein
VTREGLDALLQAVQTFLDERRAGGDDAA